MRIIFNCETENVITVKHTEKFWPLSVVNLCSEQTVPFGSGRASFYYIEADVIVFLFTFLELLVALERILVHNWPSEPSASINDAIHAVAFCSAN